MATSEVTQKEILYVMCVPRLSQTHRGGCVLVLTCSIQGSAAEFQRVPEYLDRGLACNVCRAARGEIAMTLDPQGPSPGETTQCVTSDGHHLDAPLWILGRAK